MSAKPIKTVFISYSHDSEEHRTNVRALAEQLKSNGVKVLLDQWVKGSPDKGWPLWMLDCMDNSDFVLVVCTPTYYQRARLNTPPGEGKGVKWEAVLSANMVYNNDSCNKKLIPIFFDKPDISNIPDWLAGGTYYQLNDQYINLYRHITNQPENIEPELGEPLVLDANPPLVSTPSETPVTPNVDITAMPVSTGEVVGRESEVEWLSQAWANLKDKVVTVIAMGGEGKSTLINHWLNQMQDDNWRGAAQVFAHSFYSQGTSDQRHVSADHFIDEAFRFLEYKGEMPDSAHEKGRLLAKLFCQHRTLLILDGLEPMQHPPATLKGKLKDGALEVFIKHLASNMQGLCVITSRVRVFELENRCVQHELESLSEPAGIKLLESFGVTGPKADMQNAVAKVRGHALTLNLLGSYISAACDGDIRKQDTIAKLVEEPNQGEHAAKVMETYKLWLEQTDRFEDVNLLYIIALFDRPVEMVTVDALLTGDAIAGVTDKLKSLANNKIQFAIDRLVKLKLINSQAIEGSKTLDCHPLVREYFADSLKTLNPDGYQQAHQRLYECYKDLPDKELPDTLEEMQPLFNAISHGCKAGLYQEVLYKIYWSRILRENVHYINKHLGAFATDLACIANFFIDDSWQQPVSDLTKPDQAAILNWAAFALRGLGRLHEAIVPFVKGLDLYIEQKNWKHSAMATMSISELYLSLGEIKKAIKYGKLSVDYADKSTDEFMQLANRTTYADALMNRGSLADINQAEALFIEAEQRQQAYESLNPYLYSLQGYQYCQFLLFKERHKQQNVTEVIKRAENTIKIAKRNNWLLAIALDQLTLGKAYLLKLDYTQALHYLDQVVSSLIKAGHIEFLPHGLLTRTTYYTKTRNFKTKHQAAWQDLDETFEIATFGDMKLYLCDYHLEASRNIATQLIEFDKGDIKTFVAIDNGLESQPTRDEMVKRLDEHFETAKKMIDELPYHFRDNVLEEVRVLKGKLGDSSS